ncbi:MAG: RNA polymerase sigma factor [Acidobacteriota bacterium]
METGAKPPRPPQLSADPGVEQDMEVAATLERDAQLMLRVREGDETSFALLLERHRGPVVNFLYRMVGNQSVSEELAQEVFLRVYKSRSTYEASAKFTTWLYRIATHMALNAIRDGKKEKGQQSLDQELPDGRERQVPDTSRTVEEKMVAQVRVREVRAAIDALPEKQRAAVLMHKYQGLGYAQISKALECSESATKSLLFRAYETLRSRLAHMA